MEGARGTISFRCADVVRPDTRSDVRRPLVPVSKSVPSARRSRAALPPCCLKSRRMRAGVPGRGQESRRVRARREGRARTRRVSRPTGHRFCPLRAARRALGGISGGQARPVSGTEKGTPLRLKAHHAACPAAQRPWLCRSAHADPQGSPAIMLMCVGSWKVSGEARGA